MRLCDPCQTVLDSIYSLRSQDGSKARCVGLSKVLSDMAITWFFWGDRMAPTLGVGEFGTENGLLRVY